MHFHSKIVIFCADVLCQQVDGFGTAIADSDLRPVQEAQQILIKEKLKEPESLYGITQRVAVTTQPKPSVM